MHLQLFNSIRSESELIHVRRIILKNCAVLPVGGARAVLHRASTAAGPAQWTGGTEPLSDTKLSGDWGEPGRIQTDHGTDTQEYVIMFVWSNVAVIQKIRIKLKFTSLFIWLFAYSEQEANHLKQQIDAMTETIKREKVKTAELELNTRFFDFGKNKAEEVRKIL